MNHGSRIIVMLTALLAFSTGVWADPAARDPIVRIGSAEGVDITVIWAGSSDVVRAFPVDISAGTEVTITVQVSNTADYWIGKDDIELRVSQFATNAQAPRRRVPDIASSLELTGGAPADLTDLHSYTFTMPENGADVTIFATKHARTDLSTAATLTVGTKDYTGSEQTAECTVTCSGDVLTQGTDFTMSGGSGTDVGDYTVTVTGKSKYKGTLSGTFSIVRPLGVSFGCNRNWATYYAAEDLAIPDGLQAYTVASVSCSTVTLSSALDYIPSGVGVLLYSEAGSGSDYKARAYTGTTASPAYTSMLIGATTATAMSVTNGYTNYVLYNNEFVYAETQGASLAANRCYLPVAAGGAGARELQIVFADESTGISRITTDLSEVEGAWYTVDGRKLQGKPTVKGLYIVNGKKVVVK